MLIMQGKQKEEGIEKACLHGNLLSLILSISSLLCIYLHDEYLKVTKVYSIIIVYFDFGRGSDYVYHGINQFTGLHNQEELMLSLRQQQLFMRQAAGALFPEYYVIRVNQFNDIAKDTLDEWIFYLKNGDIKEGSRAKGLDEVYKNLTTDGLNKEDKAVYLRHLDTLSNQKSVIFTAKDDGMVEGMAMGLAQAKDEGFSEGLLLAARNMKRNGEPIEKIMAFTGLSKEQIADILK